MQSEKFPLFVCPISLRLRNRRIGRAPAFGPRPAMAWSRMSRLLRVSSLLACALSFAAGTGWSSASHAQTAEGGLRAGAGSDASPRAITLPSALAFARAHHQRVLAAKGRFAAAQEDAKVPGAEWLPRVSAVAQIVGASVNNSTTTLLSNGLVDIPRVGATKVQGPADFTPYASTAVALGIRQEVYDFGRIAAERAAAEFARDIEQHRRDDVVLDVSFGVVQAYYAVLAAHAVYEASESAVQRSVAQRDFAKANITSGMRSPIDLTRAEADVARYDAGARRAEGALHVARAYFAAAVGTVERELDAQGGSPDAVDLAPLDDLLPFAARTPRVLEARARYLAAQGETRRIGAQTRPNLFATASLNARAGGAPPSAGPVPVGDGWIPAVPNYDVGLVLAWPLIDAGWSRREEAARSRETALAEDVELALRTQRTSIVAAWQSTKMAVETLRALERGNEAAGANYMQAENRFHVGIGTSVELADAQALRTDAEIQLAIGRFEVARAKAALRRALAEER